MRPLFVPNLPPPRPAYIAPHPIGASSALKPATQAVRGFFGVKQRVIVPIPIHVGHIFSAPSEAPWDFSPHL